MRSTLSLSSGKGKGSSSPRDGCFEYGGAHYERDCNASKNTGKQSSGKGKQTKSWSKSEGKGKSEENKEKSKGQSKGSKGAKGSHKGKTGISGLENSKPEARILRNQRKWDMSVPLTRHGFMMNGVLTNGTTAGVLTNGMMTGVLLDGMKVGNKTYDTSASSFSLGSLDG